MMVAYAISDEMSDSPNNVHASYDDRKTNKNVVM